MDAVFPFGFPWPTAMYLALFIVTAAIYLVFMNYVLAGGIVLLVGYVAPGASGRLQGSTPRSGLGLILRIVSDWLPAMLVGAITAGIAPLLFLQILYRRQFYTANLLLYNRLPLVLPALIIAYCMLYIIKSQATAARRPLVCATVALVAYACFLYTAWAWAENHVLGLHEEVWRRQYESGAHRYRNAEIWPRLGYSITSSFACLAVVVAWQIRGSRRLHTAVILDLATRRLRALALLGLVTSAAEAWLWIIWLDPPVQRVLASKLAIAYGAAVVLGMAVQAVVWASVAAFTDMSKRRLALLSAGTFVTIMGSLVLRESRRLAATDMPALYQLHRQAAQVGGLGVFLTFALVNTAVITATVMIVRRAIARQN